MQRRINLVEVITVRNTQEGLKKMDKKKKLKQLKGGHTELEVFITWQLPR